MSEIQAEVKNDPKKDGGDKGVVARVNADVPTLGLNPNSAVDVNTAQIIEKAKLASGN